MNSPSYVNVKVEDLRAIRLKLEALTALVSKNGNLDRESKVAMHTHLKRGKEVLDGYLQLGLFSPSQRR